MRFWWFRIYGSPPRCQLVRFSASSICIVAYSWLAIFRLSLLTVHIFGIRTPEFHLYPLKRWHLLSLGAIRGFYKQIFFSVTDVVNENINQYWNKYTHLCRIQSVLNAVHCCLTFIFYDQFYSCLILSSVWRPCCLNLFVRMSQKAVGKALLWRRCIITSTAFSLFTRPVVLL